jgi:hypothetical protein
MKFHNLNARTQEKKMMTIIKIHFSCKEIINCGTVQKTDEKHVCYLRKIFNNITNVLKTTLYSERSQFTKQSKNTN